MLSRSYTFRTGMIEDANDLKSKQIKKPPKTSTNQKIPCSQNLVAAQAVQLEFMPLQSSERDRTSQISECMDFPIKAKTVM